jgi:glycosyltransferase involved in cell wall biosynthesis
MTGLLESESRKPLVVYHILDGRVRCGASTVTKTLIHVLQNTDCNASLCFLYHGPVVEDAIEEGLPVRVMPGGNFTSILRALIWMCQDNVTEGARVILHSHQLRANRFASFAAARAKCHHVISIHTHKEEFIRDRFRNPLKRALARKWHYWTLDHADGLVAVSRGVHRELIERGYPPERVWLIHNALTLPKIPDDPVANRVSVCREVDVPDNAFLVMAAGRFVPLKRFDLLIRAAAPLSSKLPEIRVVLAGDGQIRPMLQELAERLGVAEIVRFVGWRTDLSRFVSAADCVVSCSNTETLGLTVIEAMALERPVIAAAAEDIVHLIQDKQTGVLFPPGDLSGLCEAVMHVAREPERARSMAKAGRRFAQDQFDTNATARKMVKLYKKVAWFTRES